MLTINNLSFSFGARKILGGLCLFLKNGEIGTLIGPSGAGKTTLLKLLIGTLRAQSNAISISGCFTREFHQHIAYMTQDDLLLPWRTVMGNLLLIGELGKKNVSFEELRKEAIFYLHEVGLSGSENIFPDQLSGGMRQRVSLARALMQKRSILLLDEPFGALDVISREQLYDLLRKLRLSYGLTILMITHDFRDALAISDRIFLLSGGCISHSWEVSDNMRQNMSEVQKLQDEMRLALRQDKKDK